MPFFISFRKKYFENLTLILQLQLQPISIVSQIHKKYVQQIRLFAIFPGAGRILENEKHLVFIQSEFFRISMQGI